MLRYLHLDTNEFTTTGLIERLKEADDTTAVTRQLIKLLEDFKIGGKQVHDTNIVATMLAFDIPCLLTHNMKDFERFIVDYH